jgi:hypothetical protein
VERLQQRDAAAAAAAGDCDAEDLAIDLSWLAGTARSRGPRPAASQPAVGNSTSCRTADAGVHGGSALAHKSDGDDDDDGDSPPYDTGDVLLMASQSGFVSSQVMSPSFTQLSASQAVAGGASGGGSGGRSGGARGSEHRSVRCSLLEAVWPDVVSSYR